MSFLIDTNVLSELLRARPEPAVLAWFAGQAPASLFVSAVTQAEMLVGARLLPGGRQRQRLEQALEDMFSEDFGDRILPFDSACTARYATVVAECRRAGRPISQFDAQIAAIASHHGMRLATRNTGDFEGCGLKLLDPWSARA